MEERIELAAQEVNSKEKELITRKRTAKMFLDDIVRQVNQGNIPPTFAALQLKQLTKEFTNTLKQIEEMALEDLVGTDHYIWGDYKITRREGSKTVDYSDCEEVMIMQEHLNNIKEKYKKALQGVESGATLTLEGHKFVDSEGQELNLPKWKYNKSSIVLTKA